MQLLAAVIDQIKKMMIFEAFELNIIKQRLYLPPEFKYL